MSGSEPMEHMSIYGVQYIVGKEGQEKKDRTRKGCDWPVNGPEHITLGPCDARAPQNRESPPGSGQTAPPESGPDPRVRNTRPPPKAGELVRAHH